MKIVVENIFMCFVLFWKCYFPTNFSHFLGYFLSIQTNFLTKNFKITAKSQHHTPPKLQFNPQQQTPAIKSHNHHNKNKNQNHRERSVGRRWDRVEARSSEGEIERCGVIGAVLWLTRTVRSGACDRRTRKRRSGLRRRRRRRDLASSRARALSLSLSLSLSPFLSTRLTRKWFEVKIWASNHFRGQRLIFLVNFK